MMPSRRQILEQGLAAAALPIAGGAHAAAPRHGGRLTIGVVSEPSVLTSALTTAGPTQYVSGKIFDGLVSYDENFKPQPQLAKSWQTSADGRTILFKLQPGVRWHDGKPFTSSDVAFSVLNVWKKFHARGRSTFADVVGAETPDPLTVVWHLSKPAPAIFSALNSAESQIVPRHLYEGRDILTNPHNIAPVGTGPFRFVRWQRGSYIALERNPDYWQKSKPYLDNVIFRILPDPASLVNALETSEVQLIFPAPPNEVQRLSRLPGVKVSSRSNSITAGLTVFEFNLEKPVFRDLRVRRAFAHAIDRDFLLKNVFFGLGDIATSTLPQDVEAFQVAGLPQYPFDLDKAAWLLDSAGFRPDRDGTRLTITHNPSPTGSLVQSAFFLRSTFAKIGVRLQIRTNDFATFVRRVYGQRDFDTSQYSATSGPDPAIGTQRFYWSKDFLPGVAFSNGSHYANPRVDGLLEDGQSETSPARRKAIYADFQRIVQTELPRIPMIFNKTCVAGRAYVHDYWTGAYGILENFASTYLDS
jgi:peptide/nickel transport system substrate-binding protein